MHGKGVISIWFFIGSLLAIYGVLILASGVMELSSPPARPTVLAELHAPIWWGAIMLAMGALYLVKFRPGKE